MGKTVAAVVGIVAAVAIAIAAPYLAPLALGPLGIAATATAIAVATAVISIGLSLAVSFAFRALGVGAPSARNAVGPPQVFRQSISNSFIVYGKRRAGGLLSFYHAVQDSSGAHYRYFVVAIAGHRCKGFVSPMLNDEIVTLGALSGMMYPVTSGKYAGNAWFGFQRGLSSETANSTFVSECGGKWTSAHKGNGICAMYWKFHLTDDVVDAGMPNMTAIIEGRDEILDTRTSVVGYVRNAVLCFYDWLQILREEGGFGAYSDEVPSNIWINAQANVCDETVNSNPRYAFDAVIQTGAAPAEIRDVMVVNCGGTYTFSGGQHLMRPGYYVAVSSTLSQDDLAGAIQISPFASADSFANEVSGTYISPTANYIAAPLTTQTTAGATDIRQLDVDLAFTTVKDQGDRVLSIMRLRAAADKTVVWPMNISGLGIRAMDTVQLSKTEYNLDNYAFTVTSWQFAADFGAVLNLREENSSIYTPPSVVAPVTPPTPSVPTTVRTLAEIQLILSRTYLIGTVDAIDAGSSATVRIYGTTTATNFTIDRPSPLTDVSVTPKSFTGLAYNTVYYPYVDVDPVTLLPSTWGVTTIFGTSLNSSAHPYRLPMNRTITTPIAGGGTSTGGGTGGGGYGGGGTGANGEIV